MKPGRLNFKFKIGTAEYAERQDPGQRGWLSHLPSLLRNTRRIAFEYLAVLSLACGACAGEQASVAATNPAAPVLQLRAALQVDSEGIFLNQILEPSGDYPRLRLCDAPVFGKSLVLTRAEATELAKAAGFDQVLTNWAGPATMRISRRTRALAGKEALQLLSTVLQKQFVKELGQLELRFSQPWTVINVPDEPFTIKVLDLPTSGVSPAFIARFELETEHGEHVGSWQAPLQAKVWREIWVTGSPLKRGDSLRGADLNREPRDMLLCREPLAEFSPEDDSLEFNGPVQAGSPILARLVKPRAIVHRGQSLAATVQDGALMITLKVEALEDGAAGQIIRIRNPLSRRDLRAKVLDEQNVLVFL
jgi:flagella basal body P-ring formation protein FlgA